MKYKDFCDKGLDRYCTDCVNELFHISLTRAECWYAYVRECRRCRQMKHIVTDVKFIARGKVRKGFHEDQ